MKTSEAIKGKEDLVLSKYGLYLTNNRHIDCGICGSKKSLRINIYKDNVSYICKCGSGSLIKYLQESTGADFRTIAKEIDDIVGNTHEREGKKPVNGIAGDVVKKYKSLSGLRGTMGQEYLQGRGIFKLPSGGVKYNSDEDGLQSLYAIASDENCKPVYLHRTLLNGSNKADVEVGKKMLTLNESGGSVSIKLFPVQSTLGIAEGIETALSAVQIYKCAAWATLNTSLMKRFKAPMGVDHLMIFADNDRNGAGHAAAFECAHRNVMSNNDVKRVTVRWPAEVGDFNDVLTGGFEVFEWRLGNGD